ncbi:hypothetical protein MA16_Dca008914 [Dendrobium catenatum]|uniref:Uncharacterized protein n=1 Tax=Dendrobium catenatum TaxID=906689 RepID=A0A2I0WRI9_9ASPA|nr:hypothetical protein MA16_Dca008914 [Dendrobium catenatum]
MLDNINYWKVLTHGALNPPYRDHLTMELILLTTTNSPFFRKAIKGSRTCRHDFKAPTSHRPL